MTINEFYIKRCLELAQNGFGQVAPNPMVGCIIVCNETVIGQGYHQQYGHAHAEVNAINSVENKDLLKHSTLYVNLEPCSHQGKTPPCADLIIKYEIPHVVIGTVDPNSLVAGKGIEKLKNTGCKVEFGVLEKECEELNKRFFTFHLKHRPYVILKWAQTNDRFIDTTRNINDIKQPLKITSQETDKLVHQWRTEEQAILIGTNTALLDNPQLTARLHEGKNPLRILIDKNLLVPVSYNIFNSNAPTIVFSYIKKENSATIEYITIVKEENLIGQILDALFERGISSLIVEGGTATINSFINKGVWDEARVITNNVNITNGIKAPEINIPSFRSIKLGSNIIHYHYNNL